MQSKWHSVESILSYLLKKQMLFIVWCRILFFRTKAHCSGFPYNLIEHLFGTCRLVDMEIKRDAVSRQKSRIPFLISPPQGMVSTVMLPAHMVYFNFILLSLSPGDNHKYKLFRLSSDNFPVYL